MSQVAGARARRWLRPKRWQPPAPPRRARLRRSEVPLAALRFVELPVAGPEDVRFDSAGRVLTGVGDGSILRIDLATGEARTVAHTGGRPLGLHVVSDDELLVADSRRGLLRADLRTGACTVLADRVDGAPITFASNVVADSAGTVYFTSSSRRWDLEHWRGDIIEHSGTGRLLRYHPAEGVRVLLDGLQFANGVALAPDESHLVVAETGRFCLTRYWLTGPRSGRSDVLVHNMPGYPDNISVGSDGLIWVAFASPRNPLLDVLHRLPGFVRQLIWLLPHRLQPDPEKTTWVVAYDFGGLLVHDLQSPDAGYPFVTSVVERDGQLVLAGLYASAVAVTRR
jgi:sugar lactone lactonase YvrE